MLSHAEREIARNRAAELLATASVVLTDRERSEIEVADFGLSDLMHTGLEIVTYVNTSRCCAKELILFPGQTCPEHWHPPVGADPGKEETFRCRSGEVYLYVPGPPPASPKARPPADRAQYYTVSHEIVLRPGEQYTLAPGTPHWFQAGAAGAIVSEFSTTSRDEYDVFRDPDIRRAPVVTD